MVLVFDKVIHINCNVRLQAEHLMRFCFFKWKRERAGERGERVVCVQCAIDALEKDRRNERITLYFIGVFQSETFSFRWLFNCKMRRAVGLIYRSISFYYSCHFFSFFVCFTSFCSVQLIYAHTHTHSFYITRIYSLISYLLLFFPLMMANNYNFFSSLIKSHFYALNTNWLALGSAATNVLTPEIFCLQICCVFFPFFPISLFNESRKKTHQAIEPNVLTCAGMIQLERLD